MRKIIYSMNASLDGFVVDRSGGIDWSAPDEQVHRFHNDQVRELGAHLLGRRLYETMAVWETMEEDPEATEVALDFARVWNPLPKVVFSRTLSHVEGNARLAEGDVAEEVARLKAEPGGDIGVGGADLAAQLIELDLVDEFRPLLLPVLIGGGTPFFPPVARKLDLELLETRRLGSGVVYLRYARA